VPWDATGKPLSFAWIKAIFFFALPQPDQAVICVLTDLFDNIITADTLKVIMVLEALSPISDCGWHGRRMF
jgi:hypothetical protein